MDYIFADQFNCDLITRIGVDHGGSKGVICGFHSNHAFRRLCENRHGRKGDDQSGGKEDDQCERLFSAHLLDIARAILCVGVIDGLFDLRHRLSFF